MVEAARIIKSKVKTRYLMVLPNEELAAIAASRAQVKVVRELTEAEFELDKHPYIRCQVGDLPRALAGADAAIASTGTVTMECAFFGVPTVAIYKTSWSTYQIGKRIVNVKYLAMPNLLAGEEIFPEFIQSAATPENIARVALELLQSESRRAQIRTKLAGLVSALGGPGARMRAAKAILSLRP